MAITKKARKAQMVKACALVFGSHAWGNRDNAGKKYKRPYNKTTGVGKKAFLKGLADKAVIA